MIRFSDRVPTDLECSRLAAARADAGEDIVDLTVSNPTRCGFSYPSSLLQPLASPHGLVYDPDPRGPVVARQAVAVEYDRYGADVAPESIILTSSTSEAYSLLFKLLCNPGDVVLTPRPSYPLLDQLARLDAVLPLPFELCAEDDWRPDLSRLETAPERTRAIILVHPNNPTGNHLHPDDVTRLRSLCRDRGWAMIVDEVFLPYPLDDGPAPATSLAGAGDCLTICLGGLSKAAGLPQLKLGWLTVSGPADTAATTLQRLEYIADAYLSVGAPAASAAPALLDAATAIRQEITERCRRNLDFLRRRAAAQPAVSVPHTGGGWSVVLRLPALADAEDTTIELLRHRRVAVYPGYLFDIPIPGTLVLSLLTPEDRWRRGVTAILDHVAEDLSRHGS